MRDSPASILGFIDVVEDAGSVEALRRNAEAFRGVLVDEVIGGATIQKRLFGHFFFVKGEADINAILPFTNIHGTYLRSLARGRRSKLI